MLDVAHDMSVRFEHDFAAANGPLDPPVDHNAIGFYAAIDGRLRRNEEGSAVHITLNVTVDLDQALSRNAACYLLAFGNDGSSTPEQHESLLRDTKNHVHPAGGRIRAAIKWALGTHAALAAES